MVFYLVTDDVIKQSFTIYWLLSDISKHYVHYVSKAVYVLGQTGIFIRPFSLYRYQKFFVALLDLPLNF